MDTGSLVQPGRQFTLSEIAEELGGVLEVPPVPVMTAGYADIYHGIWTNPQGEQVEVAVKELKPLIPKDRHTDPEQLNRKADTRLKREVFVWSQTTHPNLHPLLGYRLQPRPRLVSPWCRHGNLKDYLKANPGLSRGDKLRLIFQTACGLEHLHAQEPPICHADVKPENVLMNDFQGPTLSDFGLSRVLQDLDEPSGFSTSETVKGTLRYKAAELFAGQKPSLESDVYAFGGLILTVMSGKPPFYGLVDHVIIRRVMQDQPPRPVHHRDLPADDPVWTLMRSCWANRPPARPTMRDVLLELLGYTLNESGPSSRLSLPSGAEDCAEAFSNLDLDVPNAPQQDPVQSLPLNPGVAECTSSGILQTADTQTLIPEDLSTVARERLQRVELRSKAIPIIGKYISAAVEVGLNLVEIVQMDRSKNAAKALEHSIWKLVNLVHHMEAGLSQHEEGEIPGLVGDLQRELRRAHGKIKELQSVKSFRDASLVLDQADITRWQGMIGKLAEEIELLLNLNTTRLLIEFENTESQKQMGGLLNSLGDGRYGAQGNAISDVLCFPRTRVETLDRIDNWIRSSLPDNRVLWVCGMAGRGKSTIASTVAHSWEYRASCAIFHFRRGQSTLNTRFVCALARQLATSLVPEVKNAVLESVQQNQDIADQRLDTQFKTLLVAPLSKLNHQQHIVLLIVDALDECDSTKDALDFVRLIDQHSSSLPPTVRFLLTCRPEPSLVRALTSANWHMEDLDSSREVVNDLTMFIKQACQEIREGHGLPEDWPSSNDIERLVDMAQGLFQWARTAITYINDGSPINRLRDLLKRSSNLHGLDELYHQILSKAFHKVALDRSREELLSWVIGTLVVVPYPISLEVIADLYRDHEIFEAEDQADFIRFLRGDVLADLNSLLLIPSSPIESVHLIHTSVRDLLVNEHRCKERVYYIDVIQHHARMSGLCLNLMVRCLRKNICNLSDPTTANSEIRHVAEQEVSTTTRYCCRAWSIHLTEGVQSLGLSASGANSQFSDFQIFSKEKLLCWLEVMSLAGAIPEAIVTAKRVQRWLSQCTTELRSLETLWSDTRRFITAFSEPISYGPLHIYTSALPHCPSRTSLWEWYGSHAKVRTIRGLQPSTWSLNLWTRGAGASVQAISFSRDGAILTSAFRDPTIRFLDIQTGALLAIVQLQKLDVTIYSSTFSPDQKVLASGSYWNEVQLWDVQTGMPLRQPLADPKTRSASPTLSVAFSPDGSTLAAGSGDHAVSLWDVRTGTLLGEPIEGHGTGFESLAFSPDSKILASGSLDCTIRLWDAQTGTVLGEPLQGHADWVRSIAFSPDGKVLASGSSDHTVRLWDVQTRTLLGEPLEGHGNEVQSVAFSPDSKILASGSRDCTIRLWDAQTGTVLSEPLQGHAGSVYSIAFSPDGKVLASGSSDHTVRLWDVQTGPLLGEPLEGHGNGVQSVAFSPDRKALASGSPGRKIQLWGAKTSTFSGKPSTSNSCEWVYSVALSPNGEVLASGFMNHTIQLWDARTGEPSGEPLTGHRAGVHFVAFSPNGEVLASASEDRTVRLWDTQTGTALGEPLIGRGDCVTSVAFSPDGKILSSAYRNCTIQLWDIQTGTPLGGPLMGHHDCVNSVAFWPHGMVLASASDDLTIRLWDVQSGTPLGRPLTGHRHWVRSVAFSPDGTALASRSWDGQIHLWDAHTGVPLSKPLIGSNTMISFVPSSHVDPHEPSAARYRVLALRKHWVTFSSSRAIWLPCQYWRDIYPTLCLANQTLVIISNGTLSIFDVSDMFRP